MHGDDEPYGSVHRVELFNRFPAKPRLADVVSVMNRAATEDVRVAGVAGGEQRARTAARRRTRSTSRWSTCSTTGCARDAPRLDADNDGNFDDPGAAIMDAAWRPLAKAVHAPGVRTTCSPTWTASAASAASSGESYVDKDLRTPARRDGARAVQPRYCGDGTSKRAGRRCGQPSTRRSTDLAAARARTHQVARSRLRAAAFAPGPDPEHDARARTARRSSRCSSSRR